MCQSMYTVYRSHEGVSLSVCVCVRACVRVCRVGIPGTETKSWLESEAKSHDGHILSWALVFCPEQRLRKSGARERGLLVTVPFRARRGCCASSRGHSILLA